MDVIQLHTLPNVISVGEMHKMFSRLIRLTHRSRYSVSPEKYILSLIGKSLK